MTEARSGAPLRWRSGDPIELLRALYARGGVIAFPTESSYGLGADPNCADGVAAVERIKRRIDSHSGSHGDESDSERKPLPVVVADLEQLRALGIDPDSERVGRLARIWPAPLSAVLPLREGAAPAAALGRRTLAVRIPDHPDLCALLAAVGPLTATSANRTGEPPLLLADEVAALLGAAGILDTAVVAGHAPGGPPSTLIAWEGGEIRILRSGPFPAERLFDVWPPTPSRGEA